MGRMRTAILTEFLKLKLALNSLLVLVCVVSSILALATKHFLQIILTHGLAFRV